MMRMQSVFSELLLTAILVSNVISAFAAEGIISKIPDPSGNYCSMKFPAIREETLYWNRPVLKDPGDGDIIDFFGPCDHDPLGKEEIERQKAHLRHLQERGD